MRACDRASGRVRRTPQVAGTVPKRDRLRGERYVRSRHFRDAWSSASRVLASPPLTWPSRNEAIGGLATPKGPERPTGAQRSEPRSGEREHERSECERGDSNPDSASPDRQPSRDPAVTTQACVRIESRFVPLNPW